MNSEEEEKEEELEREVVEEENNSKYQMLYFKFDENEKKEKINFFIKSLMKSLVKEKELYYAKNSSYLEDLVSINEKSKICSKVWVTKVQECL